MKIFCVTCQVHTETDTMSEIIVYIDRNKASIQGTCLMCLKTKSLIISKWIFCETCQKDTDTLDETLKLDHLANRITSVQGICVQCHNTNMKIYIYCSQCRKETATLDYKMIVLTNGSTTFQGKCKNCGSGK